MALRQPFVGKPMIHFCHKNSELGVLTTQLLSCTVKTFLLQCNELNRGHPAFSSNHKLRTKELEFVHFGPNTSEIKSDWELMRKAM